MNEIHAKAVGLLKSGLTPKRVSEEIDIPYHKALKIKKELEAEDDSTMISDIAKHEVKTLLQVKDELASQAPHIRDEVEHLIDSVIGLKELEPAFHATMMRAIGRADEYLQQEDISIKEWQTVMKTLSDAYAAIFNKSGTVVNVANNNINAGHEQVSFFKNSKGN